MQFSVALLVYIFYGFFANDQLFVHDVIETTTGQRLPFGFDLTTSICRLISLDLRPCQSGHAADVHCTTRLVTPASGPPHSTEPGEAAAALAAAASLPGNQDTQLGGASKHLT